MNNLQKALFEERNLLVKVWDKSKDELRTKRETVGLDETDWKRWDDIDRTFGGRVAIIEHKMYQTGIMP